MTKGIFVVIHEAASVQVRSKSHCMAQIWSLHLLAYTYFFDCFENRGLFLLYVRFKQQYLTVVLSYTCRTFFW